MNQHLQELLDYPETWGKKVAMEHFNWMKLDKVQEVILAPAILKLAKSIDEK